MAGLIRGAGSSQCGGAPAGSVGPSHTRMNLGRRSQNPPGVENAPGNSLSPGPSGVQLMMGGAPVLTPGEPWDRDASCAWPARNVIGRVFPLLHLPGKVAALRLVAEV